MEGNGSNGSPGGFRSLVTGQFLATPARADADVPEVAPPAAVPAKRPGKGQPGYKASRKGIGGAPPLCTPEVTEQICIHLKGGNYFETACGAVGISPKAGRLWLREGAKDRQAGKKTRAAKFHEAVEKAHHAGESALVLQLRVHAQKDFRAAAFMLERKFPKRWGKTVEQTAPDATPASPLAGRSDDDLKFFVEHGHWPEEAP